jgi:hypothetical protein
MSAADRCMRSSSGTTWRWPVYVPVAGTRSAGTPRSCATLGARWAVVAQAFTRIPQVVGAHVRRDSKRKDLREPNVAINAYSRQTVGLPRWKTPVHETTHRGVGNHAAGVLRFGLGRFGTGRRYRPGRSLSLVPRGPPPQAVKPGGGYIPANPDWDTTVCHDYMIEGGQVKDGNPCMLPQFQWFQCPPGTTPAPLMPLIPNK